MSATRSRERASQLAKTDPEAALVIARGIEDPWFRSQALAWVARFSKRGQQDILREAKAASESAGEPYKIIGASAWWVRAMAELGYSGEATREVPKLLEIASTIENPVSRLEALFLLLQAVFQVDRGRDLVLEGLIAACQRAKSWRAGDRLREAALMLAADHPADAERVIEAMPEGKYKRQVKQRMASAQHRTPRPFFW